MPESLLAQARRCGQARGSKSVALRCRRFHALAAHAVFDAGDDLRIT
jgi:hypothetical protein